MSSVEVFILSRVNPSRQRPCDGTPTNTYTSGTLLLTSAVVPVEVAYVGPECSAHGKGKIW